MGSVNNLDPDMLQRMANNAGMPLENFIEAVESYDPESRTAESIEAAKEGAKQALDNNNQQDVITESYQFEQNGCKSYMIEVNPESKIGFVLFRHGNRKYKVAIKSYEYSETSYKNYQEKNGVRSMVSSLSNLKLGFIQKKVQSGYSGNRKSQSFGIDFLDLRSFCNSLIINYHSQERRDEKLA